MDKKKGVSTLHPDYVKNLPKWDQVDDCIEGSIKIKEEGERYLPNPEAELSGMARLGKECFPDDISYNRYIGKINQNIAIRSDRYLKYLLRAMFYNFTKRTKDGLVGGVYRKDPTIDELPPKLAYLMKNADGNGVGVIQQSKTQYDQVLRKGRDGLLVDMPSLERTASKLDVDSGVAVPRILPYKAQSIINWKTKRIGAAVVLVRVVLLEYTDDDTEFGHDCEKQYRELALDENGYYVQRLYNEKEELIASFEPKINGKRMTRIPFFFIGSENNDYHVDDSPLFDLSDVNISHYRNSADNEESSFITGQPTPVIAPSEKFGDAQAWNEANPEGVKLGARTGINVGPGGNAFLLQANPNTQARQNMLDKEQQALAIGADLITPSSNETAEATRIKKAADTAIAASIANNVSSAYTGAIKQCGEFLGVEYEGEFKLSTDFFMEKTTPQERAQWAADVMTGTLPAIAYRDLLRKTGELEYSESEVTELLEAQEFGVEGE